MSLIPTIVNWYGGKVKLARQIISIMPEHEHYVEVFMGSAATFFAKPKVQRNCLNDINSNLNNLFTQVRDNGEQLFEKVYWTLYSRDNYREFYKHHLNNYQGIDDITRAMMYLFLVRASFNSRTGLGFSASIESNSANFNLALIERLKLAREKLDGVVLENISYQELIPKYGKGSDVFLYLDPPYWVTIDEETYYEGIGKTFVEYDHLAMASSLQKVKSPWIISYDDVPEIVDLYKEYQIQRIRVRYSLSNSKKKVREINELLITNYKAKKPQIDIFDEDVKFDEITDEEKKETEIQIKLLTEQKLEKESKKIKTHVITRPDSIVQEELLTD